MRITGGKARGIPLSAPRGDTTRPATDRMREAVFSSLGPAVEGCRVADLFAGTGSYGLEALSRGATACTFYESERAALACLRRNAAAVLKSAALGADSARIVGSDVSAAPGTGSCFDLIFVDPPYHCVESGADALFADILGRIAADDAVIVFEVPGHIDLTPGGWKILRRIGKAGRDKPTALILKRTPSQ